MRATAGRFTIGGANLTDGDLMPVYISDRDRCPDVVRAPIQNVEVRALARSINPNGSLVEVKKAGRLRLRGWCYWNVADVVKESGGTTQGGWLFFWWPNFYIEAMHHAVWRRPDGTLLDVTESYPSDAGSKGSTFMCDDSISTDPSEWPCVAPQFAYNGSLKPVADLIALYQEQHAFLDEGRYRYGQVGLTSEQCFRQAAKGEPFSLSITDSNRHAMEQLHAFEIAKNAAAQNITAAIFELRRWRGHAQA